MDKQTIRQHFQDYNFDFTVFKDITFILKSMQLTLGLT